MLTRRPCYFNALLFIALTGTRLTAQTAEERSAIGVMILTDWIKSDKMLNRKPDQILFEPAILRGVWLNGVQRDTTSPRDRDSSEIARLSAALGVKSVTPEITQWCAARFVYDIKKECTPEMRTSATIAISDPRFFGDTATVLLRTGGLVSLAGNSDILGSRMSIVYLIKLVRRDRAWTIHCATLIGGDGIPRASDVEKSCKPGN